MSIQPFCTELQSQASNKAIQIARQRYNTDSGEFLDLFDAEREQLRSGDQLAQLQQQSFICLVDIYRSFGGGIQLI